VSGSRAALIEALFPQTVAVAVWEPGDVLPPLYPAEGQSVSRSVEKRRLEFARGRACARRALVQLGVAAGPIAVGDNRAPLWPAGVVGSITHCDGLVAAVAAFDANEPAVGIDAEVCGALQPDLVSRICTRSELAQIGNHEGPGDWYTLIFSAKESIHKALHPTQGVWLEFADVELTIDFAAHRFEASPCTRLERELPVLASIRGRFEFLPRHVVTATVLRGEGFPPAGPQ